MNTNTQITNRIDYTPDQIALIKKQIAPQANENELKLFLYQCQRTGLDALSRQIYCIHRGGKMTIQTSIDGFRVIAERSGDYAGQDEPIFTETADGQIISCKVAVYRFKGDLRYQASVGVAYMSEYNAGGPMWSKMPHTMISKCAEAVALRKAYPQDLSGLYTGDEMQQSEVVEDVPTEEEKKLLVKLVYDSDLNAEERETAFDLINNCPNYKKYEQIQHKLEARAKPIDQIINPNEGDVKKHIKKLTTTN